MKTETSNEQNDSMRNISLGGFNDYASARAFAIGAGDMSTVVRKEVKRILETNRNDILKSLQSGLQELVSRNLVSAQECEQLDNIFKHLLGSIRGKEDGEEAFLSIRNIYQELLMEQNASPTAPSYRECFNFSLQP